MTFYGDRPRCDHSNCVMSDQQCVCGVGGWPVRVMFLSTIDNVYIQLDLRY